MLYGRCEGVSGAGADLSEVEHAGAEGRGGAEEHLHKATGQLEALGHAPHVRLLQQSVQHQGQIQTVGHLCVHRLRLGQRERERERERETEGEKETEREKEKERERKEGRKKGRKEEKRRKKEKNIKKQRKSKQK